MNLKNRLICVMALAEMISLSACNENEVTEEKSVNSDDKLISEVDSIYSTNSEDEFGISVLESTYNDYAINNENETETKTEIAVSETDKAYEYDDLQQLFIQIDEKITIESLEESINSKSLCFTSEIYKGSKLITYRIAYTDDVALQSYGETGDSLEVAFSSEDSTFEYSSYFNAKSFYNDGYYEALLYDHGIYNNFNDEGMLGDYTGYYGRKNESGRKNGIIIKYNNGNSAETDFYSFDSAELVINKIIDDSEK